MLCAPKAASYKQVWGSRYMGTKVSAQACAEPVQDHLLNDELSVTEDLECPS